MCGIAGIISHQVSTSPSVIRLMTASLAHRGPDGEGFWANSSSSIHLGHRRLSILDTGPGAAQPMHYLGRYTIVHNGEIYNYREIRDVLSVKGYRFISQSDAEVILAAYDCYREQCLQYFDGMFSFSIWDEKEGRLFAARDRFGEKPFYYAQQNDQLLWASEMKALWAAGIRKELFQPMLLNYLALGWVEDPTDPAQTFFKHIRSLPRAHYLYYDLSSAQLKISKYWDIDIAEETDRQDPAYYTEAFREKFFTSVHRRLRAEVPIGTSLSGGLDSSSIVAAIDRDTSRPDTQKVFTCVFPGFEKDESAFAKKMSAHFHLQQYTVQPSAEGMVRDFEKLMYLQEEPLGSAGVYLQYCVMELAKQQGVTVILDGQGADEILGGYSKYIHWYLQHLLALSNHTLFRAEKMAFSKNIPALEWGWKNRLGAIFPGWASKHLEAGLLHKIKSNADIHPDFLHTFCRPGSLHKPRIKTFNDILYFNSFHFGLGELLRYADRNAMAHGREIRLPFLSHELVSFIFQTPARYKMRNGYTKHLLRRSMESLVPKEILWRKEKIGFEPPQQSWMEHHIMQDFIHESKKRMVEAGVLRKNVLQKKIIPRGAYEADNFDWRYLSAAHGLFNTK